MKVWLMFGDGSVLGKGGFGAVSDADPGRLRGFERMADWIEHLCTAAYRNMLDPTEII